MDAMNQSAYVPDWGRAYQEEVLAFLSQLSGQPRNMDIVLSSWQATFHLAQASLSPQSPLYREEAAETVDYCYKQSQSWLRRWSQAGVTTIHLFQTGYQPAVLGFYRALIEEKHRNPHNTLLVAPFYFEEKKHRYWRGEIWA